MSNITTVRGMRDYFGNDAECYDFLTKKFVSVAKLYGYRLINTPIVERESVFTKSLGETSDVVSKEMYSFPDRNGDQLVLRPEGTASIVRAVVENNLCETLPAKFAYFGPMFRYERPQKGRYRQFHQLGLECFSKNDGPARDAEAIILAYTFLKSISSAKIRLELSTLGSVEDRAVYLDELVRYLEKHESSLSEVSKDRLHKNPLRILDSKESEDQEIISNAPKILDTLAGESLEHFNTVTSILSDFGVESTVNPYIVRGLDYYMHTVFEFKADEIGSQSTVLAGGRYDGFVKLFGGPDVAGVGWAAGFERLMLIADPVNAEPIHVVVISDQYNSAVHLSSILRSAGVVCEFLVSQSFKKALTRAIRFNSKFVVFCGLDEREGGYVNVKNLQTSVQTRVEESGLADFVKNLDN